VVGAWEERGAAELARVGAGFFAVCHARQNVFKTNYNKCF
jgi:hypothetical protein